MARTFVGAGWNKEKALIDLITNAPSPYLVAKTLARQGVAVFPVRSRRPLTKRGFYSATADPALQYKLKDENFRPYSGAF